MKSIFELIINGEMSGNVLYENEKVICLLDIKPYQLGHVLIIPKEKKVNILLEEDETIIELFRVSNLLKQAYNKILNLKGVKLISNVGKEASQVVFHTHLHFIPFYEVDTRGMLSETQIKLTREELKNLDN